MGNANTTDDFDLDFAGLGSFVPETRATKVESRRNFAAESFEKIVQAVELKMPAAPTASVSFVTFKGQAHVWVKLAKGWTKFSTATTKVDSVEQERIIERAIKAHPGCDIGVSSKRSHL